VFNFLLEDKGLGDEMNFHKYTIFIITLILIISTINAANMQLDFKNDYASSEEYELQVYIDANSDGVWDAGYDYNVLVYIDANADGNFDLNTYFSGETSVASDGTYGSHVDANVPKTGDFNIVVSDLNSLSLTQWFNFYVPEFHDLNVNFTDSAIEMDENIEFKFHAFDSSGVQDHDYNSVDVNIYDNTGSVVYSTTLDRNASDANATVPLDVNVSEFDNNGTPGKYYVSTEKGYKTFSFNVETFKAFISVQDDSGNARKDFTPGETAYIKVKTSDTSGSPLDTNIMVYVNDILADSDDSNAYLDVTYSSTSSTGHYPVKVLVTYGGYTQTFYSEFVINSYYVDFYPVKNSLAGMRERKQGTFGPSVLSRYALTLNDVNGTVTLSTSDCNSLLKRMIIKKPGISYWKTEYLDANKGTDINLAWNSTNNRCDVNFLAPSTQGEYEIQVDTNNVSEYGISHSILNVKAVLLFFSPTDPASENLGFKFGFYDGEDVGLIPQIINLMSSNDDIDVNNLDSLALKLNGTSYDINSDYWTWYDSNAGDLNENLILISNTLFTDLGLGGGFYDVEAVLDTNNNSYQDVTAYGSFKYKVFSLTIAPYDTNSSSEKMEMFGPPVFKAEDENVGLQVTVKNSSNQAIAYADVNVISLRNFQTNEEVDVSSFDSGLTNSSGIATLNLGTMETGTYMAEVQATNESRTDTGMAFFMVKNYMSFMRPTDPNDYNTENEKLGKDQNFFGILMAFNPFAFSEVTDATISGNLRVYREGGDEEFKAEKVVNVSYDVNNDFSTTLSMGPGGGMEVGSSLTIYRTDDANWNPGYYHFFIDVSSATNGNDTAEGFFHVQDFSFNIFTDDDSEGGMEGEGGPPKSYFDPCNDYNFYIQSSIAGELRLSLRDDKTWDYACANCSSLSIDTNAGAGASDTNMVGDDETTLVTVKSTGICGNVKYGGEYILEVLGDNQGVGDAFRESSDEMFLETKLYNLYLPLSTENGGGEIRTVYYYEDNETGRYDSNIENNTDHDFNEMCGFSDFNSDYLGALSYDAVVFYPNGIFGGNVPTSYDNDLNYPMLINFTNETVILDLDKDCNFLDDNASGYIYSPGETIPIDVSGATPLLTGVERNSLKYILIHTDTNAEAASYSSFNNWYGEYDIDGNVLIPVVITDLFGSAVGLNDVNVYVNRVTKVDFYNMQPESLTAGTDYNAYDDNTDANGIAIPKITIAKTGDYQVELVLKSSDGNIQKINPWNGPMFAAKRFTVRPAFINKHRATQSGTDYNYGFIIDLNLSANKEGVSLSGSNLVPFVGRFDELTRDYDLDHDGSKDKNWYVVYESTTGNYQIDDDVNLTDPSSNEVNSSMVVLNTNWPTCIGPYQNAWDNNCDSSNTDARLQLDSTVMTLDDQNVDIINNGGFEDINSSSDTSLANNWVKGCTTYGLDNPCNDYNIWTDVADVNAGTYTTTYVLGADNNGAVYITQDLGNDSDDENVMYTLTFRAKLETDGPGNEMSAVLTSGGYDYNFPDNNWIPHGVSYPASYFDVTADWQEYSVDFNTIDNNFPGSNISLLLTTIEEDKNLYVDEMQLDRNVAPKRVVVYNKYEWRAKPASPVDFSNLSWNYMLWEDANRIDAVGSVDNNVYLQVEMRNLDKSALDVNASSSVYATLIKQNSCGSFNQGTKGTKTTGTFMRSGIWSFNFGELIDNGADANCTQYQVRIDENILISGTYYTDVSWEQLFFKNE
jgi:hypothetical protein